MNRLIITKKDNFVFIDVTEIADKLLGVIDLYALHDDETESHLESALEIDEALHLKLPIVIEAGHLPTQYRNDWKDSDKKLIDGKWYRRFNFEL